MPAMRSHGPAKGAGWGGPAKGAASKRSVAAPEFTEGNKVAAGYHDMTGVQRAEALKAELFRLALSAQMEPSRIAAAVAFLNREEGMPIARNVNVNTDDISSLDDATLSARLEAAERELHAVGGGIVAAPNGSSRTH